MHQISFLVEKLLKFFLIFLISLYKILVSPFLGKNCRFYPSCSNYSLEAVKKYNILISIFLISRRIIFCNPWNFGGYKNLPKSFSMKRYLSIRLAAIKTKLLTFNMKK